MTDRLHPLAEQAIALVESERFCEWLDAVAARPDRWPHTRFTARRWLEKEMGVGYLTWVGTSATAAAVLRQVQARHDLWQRNEELALEVTR